MPIAHTRERRNSSRGPARAGAILIVVLFVMAVASLMALSLAYRAALVSRLARDTILRIQMRAQADSAVAVALAALAVDGNAFDHPDEPWARPVGPAEMGWLAEWTASAEGGDPEFSVSCQVQDEQGKRNVLYASDQALEALGLSKAQRDCLFDWMDADADVRPEGAEGSYYRALPHAYPCKDRPIEALDELLLVRHFDVAGFWGPPTGEEDSAAGTRASDTASRIPAGGLIDCLTPWGDGRINLNTASKEVLQTLPIGDSAVSQILAYRALNPDSGERLEDHVFQSSQDIEQLQGLSPADRAVLKDAAVFRSEYYRIVVGGRHGRSGITYRLSVLVHKGQEGPPQVLQWSMQP